MREFKRVKKTFPFAPRLFTAHLLLIDSNCPIFASLLAILSLLLTRIHINPINGSFKLMTSKPIHFTPFSLLLRWFLLSSFQYFFLKQTIKNMFQFSSCLKFDFLMPFLCCIQLLFHFVCIFSILSFHHLMVSHSFFYNIKTS